MYPPDPLQRSRSEPDNTFTMRPPPAYIADAATGTIIKSGSEHE